MGSRWCRLMAAWIRTSCQRFIAPQIGCWSRAIARGDRGWCVKRWRASCQCFAWTWVMLGSEFAMIDIPESLPAMPALSGKQLLTYSEFRAAPVEERLYPSWQNREWPRSYEAFMKM